MSKTIYCEHPLNIIISQISEVIKTLESEKEKDFKIEIGKLNLALSVAKSHIQFCGK